MIIYFSGTGNTKYFVDKLNEQLQDTIVDVTRDSLPTDLTSETSLGIVFPIYAWGMPAICKKRLAVFFRQAKLQRDALYTYVICVCGDDMGTTEKEVRNFLAEYDIVMNAIKTVKMPDTYVAMPGFDLDKISDGNEKIKFMHIEVNTLATKIKERQTFRETIPGGYAWVKSTLIRPLFNAFWTSDKYYKVSDACIGCGKCATVCPTTNITYDKNKQPVWHHNCAACLACYHVCPVNAISYHFTSGKGQYRLKNYL